MAKLSACALHNPIEGARLYQYDVRVTLRDRSRVFGRAINTTTRPDKIELLVAGEPTRGVLNDLRRTEVLTAGAKFQHLDFAPESD